MCHLYLGTRQLISFSNNLKCSSDEIPSNSQPFMASETQGSWIVKSSFETEGSWPFFARAKNCYTATHDTHHVVVSGTTQGSFADPISSKKGQWEKTGK